MSTNISEQGPGSELLKQLWVPRSPNRQQKPGMILQDMQKRGRAVNENQRNRWVRNRLYYQGEHYLKVVGRSVRTLAPPERLPAGKRRDMINLLRRFVDGRVAMMTWKTPAFQVLPAGYSADQIDAARLATKFVRAKWDENEWDLTWVFRRLCLAGEVDGIVYLNVVFNPQKGKKVLITIDLATGQPIFEKDKSDAALQMGMAKQEAIYEGDVDFRVVRAGAMGIDPSARDDYRDANWVIETRVEDRAVIEAQAQIPVSQLINRHKEAMDEGVSHDPYSQVDYGQVSVEESDGTAGSFSMKDMVTTHTAYIRPHGEWPKGAHVKWLDIAPTQPFIVEPYDDELPYFPYTPRPHGGLFQKSKGIVDDLIPAQDRFNRVLTQLGEWLDRVARPPLIITNGSLSNETPQVFNEKGFVVARGTVSEPHFMHVPPEPAAITSGHLAEIVEWMQRLAVQTDATQGEAPGRVDSAIGIQSLQEADERQMSIPESELRRVMQWGVSRALRQVEKYYSVPRMINAPGVTDSIEFNAFVGGKLKGATRFHIEGPLLPRSRAAREEQLMKLLQVGGENIDWTLHFSNILDGEVEAIVERERAEQQQQRRENADMIALHQMPDIDRKWTDFLEMQEKYVSALKKRPREQLMAEGIYEPKLKWLGIPLPQVEEGDRHADHLNELDAGKAAAEWKHYHPLVKQAWREHRQDHVSHISRILSAGPPEPIGGAGGGGASPGRQAEKGQPAAPRPAGNNPTGGQ